MQNYLIPIIILLSGYLLYRIYSFYFIGGTKPTENANLLGTNSKSNNIFHQLLLNPATINFKHEGIILCFEKVKRSKLIVTNGQPDYFSVADQYDLFGIDPALNNVKERGLLGAIRLIKRTLDDPKPIVLTHWLETGERMAKIRYNAYKNIKNKDYHLPCTTLAEYDIVGKLVKEKLLTGRYSHVVIACTGWNNKQESSLHSYNDWLQHTANAAKEDELANTFKPFFIGLTWPSLWMTPMLSIINKANDADELGMTHINYFLWKTILPLLSNTGIKIPLITIGHSLGARIMSRAVRFMLREVMNTTNIDLTIDFQGAYPLTRFCESKGNNGGLYTVDVPVKVYAMTCSKFDHAIKAPLWSSGYIGNNIAIDKLKNNMTTKDFGFCEIDETGRFIKFPENHRKILVDAKSIINHINNFFAGAHSDVMDKEAGRFIWELIKKNN